MTGESSRIYSAATAATIAFIVWGSLFPFESRSMTLVEARDLLWSTRGLLVDLASWSFTDVVSNAALFVPFGLFVSAQLDRRWGARPTVALPLAGSFLLSGAVEFSQAYIIWRAPSLLDVAAAVSGAVVGLILWRVCRRDVESISLHIKQLWEASNHAERGLLIYTGIFACAWLAPFDVTIRPDEIRDKYQHQRLLLVPLSASPDAATPSWLALTLVAAIPVGMASQVCPRRERWTPGRAVAVAALSLLILEAVQVSVFSRTTDATELLVAVPGAALGAYLAPRR
jgi:glycopeptide antibiotics resistance protein